MPLELDQTSPVLVTYTFRDDGPKPATVGVYYNGELDFPLVVQEAVDAGAIIANMSDGVMDGATITFNLINTGTIGTSAPPTSEVERKGVFTFGTANRNEKFSHAIPSLIHGLTVPGSNRINTADPRVVAYLNLMVGDGDEETSEAVTYLGNELTRLIKGIERHYGRKDAE